MPQFSQLSPASDQGEIFNIGEDLSNKGYPDYKDYFEMQAELK